MAQISPGKLANGHAKLEGLSNCTSCHELGDKVSSAKCLACHKEIKNLTSHNEGYHVSPEVKGKECFACHSDHHGRTFQIVRFDTLKFNHQLSGYELRGKHSKISCSACHKSEFVKTKISQKTSGKSFLGMDTKCLSCHADFHQKTLSVECASCHGFDAFKPAPGFIHQNTKYPLIGKHADVGCIKCHPKEMKDGKDFQRFSGIAFANCTDCHKDVHDNKFGPDCRKCHSEVSFHQIQEKSSFDHSKTGYPLLGKHQSVDCKKCHPGSFTAPIKFDRCDRCHADYHKGQFVKNQIHPDCKECHQEKSFAETSFSTERHNQSSFKLDGAHAATPCIACHRKDAEWKFGEMANACISCHQNIHQNHISEKYLPENRCESCHQITNWTKITFDHQKTGFPLQGKHDGISCRDCHFKKETETEIIQKFAELKGDCQECHHDVHGNQFKINEKTDCSACHGFENWKADRFDHNLTRFKLDGGHQKVECKKCHLPNKSGTVPFIQYKNTEMKCKSCHI